MRLQETRESVNLATGIISLLNLATRENICSYALYDCGETPSIVFFFFAAEYAKLPLLPPYLHPGQPEYIYGVNFASGGSGALSQTSQGSVSSCLNSLNIFFYL